MIKKMMALLAAISCAIGAWADVNGHLSGTDFSGLGAGSFVTGRDDSGQDSGTTYWFVGDTADFEGTIVTNLLEEKFLDFESNITNPLYRTISGCWGAEDPSGFVTNSIGTGLFIDTTVQFTPYLVNENHPAPTAVTAEDKLIVWVRETEVEDGANVTNLIVTAGYWTADPAVVASNYVSTLSSADVSALCAGTHRLTIKSFENILNRTDRYIMGFVVYIDETAVQYIGDAFQTGCTYLNNIASTPGKYHKKDDPVKQLFPSLLTVGTDSTPIAEYSVLSGVGYAGMGKIGDVFFDTYQTDYPSFAADDLSFDVVVGDGVTEFYYLGEPYTTNCTFSVAAATPSVTISNVSYNTEAGYKHKTGTWHNNVTVDNQVGEGGDYGTFVFANGTTLTLAGFKPNYIVNGAEFDTLLGADGALAAALLGHPLVLNSDVVINEGTDSEAGCLWLDEGETLVLDLNGHTIRGAGDQYATIVNNGGTLTIVDTSENHDGKVLDGDSGFCLVSYVDSKTTLNAGEYESIDELSSDPTTIDINGGTYYDPVYNPDDPDYDEFYLIKRVAKGATVSLSQDPDTQRWYATVSSATPVTTYAVTFSTNDIVVAEHNTNIAAGEKLPVDAIPAFTGGAWDVDPTNAVINAATNFNYTIPPADPWAPDSKTDEAAYNKVVEVFGEAVAEKIHTYDAYTNMVSYLAGKGTNPDDFKTGGAYAAAAPYVYQSYILGADELFTAEPKVTVTAVAANATTAGTGMWDFTVKVTEGKSTDAYSVAADKVAALVKIRTSLTTGTWDAPTNITADKVDDSNLIKVTINFGNGTSGFMKVAE